MAAVRLAGAAIVTLVAGLASAPAVSASDVVLRAEGSRYSPATLTIAQGQHVTFENGDSTQHSVISNDYAPDGSRLFRSATIDPGASAPVAGTEYLTTGDYAFFCSVHREMHGSLHVTAEGSPVPRPQTPDTTRPGLQLSVLTRSAVTALRRRALLVHVRSTENVRVRLVARSRGRKIAAGRTTLRRAGFRGARLRLTRRGRKLLGRAARVRLSVRGVAVDLAGNSRRDRARRTLFGG